MPFLRAVPDKQLVANIYRNSVEEISFWKDDIYATHNKLLLNKHTPCWSLTNKLGRTSVFNKSTVTDLYYVLYWIHGQWTFRPAATVRFNLIISLLDDSITQRFRFVWLLDVSITRRFRPWQIIHDFITRQIWFLQIPDVSITRRFQPLANMLTQRFHFLTFQRHQHVVMVNIKLAVVSF